MACRFETNVKSILMKGLNLDFEKKFVDYFQGVKTLLNILHVQILSILGINWAVFNCSIFNMQ